MSKIPVSPEEKDRVRGMVDRMTAAYGVDKKDLPEIIETPIGTINNWVHFGRKPFDQMVKCSQDTGVTLDWLIKGEANEKPTLNDTDIAALLDIVKSAINGAVAYETLQFCYPDAGEKLLKKLQKDLESWHKGQNKPNDDQGA